MKENEYHSIAFTNTCRITVKEATIWTLYESNFPVLRTCPHPRQTTTTNGTSRQEEYSTSGDIRRLQVPASDFQLRIIHLAILGGMHIIWTFPEVPSWNTMFMLEAMTFKIGVAVEKSIDPSGVVAEAWSNVYHKDNPEGEWHSIPLQLIETAEHSGSGESDLIALTFGNAVMLTSDGEYRFTFRVRYEPATGPTSSKTADWIWANGYMQDGVITVRPPFGDKWSKGPDYNHIMDVVHLGNFMAASIADILGFDAVLNLADTLDLVTTQFKKPVTYKKIPMNDGAVNAIPEEQIREAVDWLQEHSRTHKKILVNCRAGIGRAGSVVVSYVFAQSPEMSYEEAYNYVFSRRFVYPHKGLRDTLYRLYPRDK
ncbi:hypothetical protein BaRGS_00003191 [Batillaria attramentaria]|uniref:protein-tyrosine-phosphatase n=1 Tax=Batillaria attramentaria TaxID=370345 RepID=A0ABD0M1R5_9CAEN